MHRTPATALVGLLSLSLLAGLAGTPVAALAQENPDPTAGAEAAARMQAAMQKASTLGDAHAAMAELLGDWEVEIRVMLPGMGDAEPSRARARIAWAIPGRWLSVDVEGEMMGMPYRSFTLRGYDSWAQAWVSASVTSLDNALNTTRGPRFPGADGAAPDEVVVEYGFLNEYLTGEIQKPYKTVLRVESPDRHVQEVWDLAIDADGEQVVEMVFTRR